MAACPYCGGAPGRAAFPWATEWRGRVYVYHDCPECGVTFIDPLPAPAELDALFDPDAFHRHYYARPEPSAEQRATVAWMAPRVAAGGTLLDVGCANGAFMRAAAEAGYRPQGVEQNDAAIAFAADQSGFAVRSLAAVEAAGDRFDIVHVADVLNHLPDPAAFMRRLEALLAPGGRLVIEGPLEKQANIVRLVLVGGSGLKRALGRRAPGEHPPLHLSFAGWGSTRRFLERRLGYRLVSTHLYETGWPFPVKAEPGAGTGERVKAAIGRLAVRLSTSRLGDATGAWNRFRIVAEPAAKVR